MPLLLLPNRQMNRSSILAVSLVAAVLTLAGFRSVSARSARAFAITPAPLAIAPGEAPAAIRTAADDTAVFAGGCFWGIEGVFEHIKGVKSAVSGYAGGSTASPTYEQVSGGNTGHAEVVRVIYDPAQISYDKLLHVFFSVAHDPTQLNRQGPDHGTQYRSAIFYTTPEQQRSAERYIDQLTKAKFFRRPIVTQVQKLSAFYEAEAYHQDYMVHHPNQLYIVLNDAPKVAALKKQFPELYRD